MNNYDDHNLQPNAPFRLALTLATVLTLLSGAAYGQVPTTNDTSDINHNTGMGTNALGPPRLSNPGGANTASGFDALYTNIGDDNTAFGALALESNTTGSNNTASGVEALFVNTTGINNTATGYRALYSNTVNNYNTASGFEALYNNAGEENTASGAYALYSNTTGQSNIASGNTALYSNTTGSYNTASGGGALGGNTTGQRNTASGLNALFSNSTGSYNTASGFEALYYNTTGNDNIAVGYEAGFNPTGSNNIDIGNEGLAADNGAIRIGTAGSQTEVFISGIHTSKITGSAVYVTAGGRLGVLASSERYKTAIAPMGSNTAKLEQLRPVTFKLKSDPKGAIQYGLIAEEVAKVFPELVTRDEKGRIDGVRYDELAPMLLNEMQQQQQINSAQAAEIRELKGQVAELNNLKEELRAALQELKSKDQLVAQR